MVIQENSGKAARLEPTPQATTFANASPHTPVPISGEPTRFTWVQDIGALPATSTPQTALLDVLEPRNSAAKERLLKFCSRDLQAFRVTWNERISSLIGANQVSKKDREILTQMDAAIKSVQDGDDIDLERVFQSIVKQQFQLQSTTRHTLARSIPSPNKEFDIDYGLEPGSPISRSLNEAARLVVKVALFKALKVISERTKNDVLADTHIDSLAAGTPITLARKRAIERVETGIRANQSEMDADKIIMELRQAQELTGVDVRDKVIMDKLKGVAAKMFECCETIAAPVALTYTNYGMMRLVDCVTCLKPDTRFPNQLLDKIEFMLTIGEPPELFADVKRKLEVAEEDILACGDTVSGARYAIEHVDYYRALNKEIEEACNNKLSRKKIKAREEKHAVDLSQENLSATQSPSPSEYAGKEIKEEPDAQLPSVQSGKAVMPKPASAAATSNDRPGVRRIYVRNRHRGSSYIETKLSDADLKIRMQSSMGEGTFKTALNSAGYHIPRHAKGMLIEEYLDLSDKAFKFGFFGEVVTLMKNPYKTETATVNEEKIYAKRVRGEFGDGCFTWEGKVLWFEPPVKK